MLRCTGPVGPATRENFVAILIPTQIAESAPYASGASSPHKEGAGGFTGPASLIVSLSSISYAPAPATDRTPEEVSIDSPTLYIPPRHGDKHIVLICIVHIISCKFIPDDRSSSSAPEPRVATANGCGKQIWDMTPSVLRICGRGDSGAEPIQTREPRLTSKRQLFLFSFTHFRMSPLFP